ncbi:MFS transporter [Nonomuraea ferruginea]
MTTVAEPPLLHDPSFRNFYLASAVSQFGTQVGYVAMPLLAVIALNAGPGQVGLLSALTTITVLVLGLPAGAWVDRVRRRPVMIATDLVRAVLLVSVTVTWWLDALTMTQLYGVAIATGIGTLFFDVASQSTVPHLVGRDRLTAANSVLVGTNAAMDVGGRSSAGVLVALAGAPVAILLDALTYLWSAVWLRRISKPEPAPAPRTRRATRTADRRGGAIPLRQPGPHRHRDTRRHDEPRLPALLDAAARATRQRARASRLGARGLPCHRRARCAGRFLDGSPDRLSGSAAGVPCGSSA